MAPNLCCRAPLSYFWRGAGRRVTLEVGGGGLLRGSGGLLGGPEVTLGVGEEGARSHHHKWRLALLRSGLTVTGSSLETHLAPIEQSTQNINNCFDYISFFRVQ